MADEKKSGATNEVGAPEIRIVVPLELVLTPRDNDLTPVLGPVVTALFRRIARARAEVNPAGSTFLEFSC